MLIKRSKIKQKLDIIAEKSESNDIDQKTEKVKCYVCNKEVDFSSKTFDCSNKDCPFSSK